MPGETDNNRAFAFTGSALGTLNNFQNGNQYIYWPFTPHRASIWKVLWANGVTDWKIYNSVEWMSFIHTYHLFLQGQIPTVDANLADYTAASTSSRRRRGRQAAGFQLPGAGLDRDERDHLLSPRRRSGAG